jgi:hypothetical protein
MQNGITVASCFIYIEAKKYGSIEDPSDGFLIKAQI